MSHHLWLCNHSLLTPLNTQQYMAIQLQYIYNVIVFNRCVCSAGFTGFSCEADINECLTNPCLNNATCVNTLGSYWCSCATGFTGYSCQLDVNRCRSSPCLNGATCVNLINGFQCSCAAGFTGTRCEVEIDECMSTPCFNGATCLNQVCDN